MKTATPHIFTAETKTLSLRQSLLTLASAAVVTLSLSAPFMRKIMM